MKPLFSVAQLGCPEGFSDDAQGWNSDSPFFAKVISKAKPQVIVEVGTWKGASTIHMAGMTLGLSPVNLSRVGPGAIIPYSRPAAKIYCVDTWLGGIDHLTHEGEGVNNLLRRHGYPQLYFQFLHNVTKSGYADRIFPIAQTSANGARVLKAQGITADLCYLDGSHEINDVYADICAYWPLLRDGGTMFGDDYDDFCGVYLDVNRFAAERKLAVEVENGFWAIRKQL